MQGKRTGTNPVKIDVEPKVLIRLQRIARELRLTGQILSFDLDSVQLVDGGGIAWTSPDGSTITINAARMPSVFTRKGVAVWLGTYAHELFHNQFTPRSTSRLMRRIATAEGTSHPGMHRCWNILEDQRIERLGLARYAPWRGYLIAALSKHIACDTAESWLLLAGRTWLPAEVRAIARSTFVATNDEATAVLAATLIGDYQRLSDPGDTESDEAWRIVEQFWDAFRRQVPTRGGCGSDPIDEGDPEEGDDDGNPWPTADEAEEPDDEPAESDESDDGQGEPCPDGDESDDEPGDGDGEDADGDADGDADDDGDGSGKGDADSEADTDGDDDDPDDGVSDEGDGKPGDGVSEPGQEPPRSMDEAMKDAIDEALKDDETADDLDRVMDQVDHGATSGGDLPRKTGGWGEVTDKARSLAREVSDVLAAIKDDNEAAWVRRTDSGRFNVGRWATDPDWDADNIFDEFQPGAMDASSLDCVLLLDVSGSMSSQNLRLAEATWAIRHAIDRVEGTCTVLGFGWDASIIFDAWQRPDGRIFVPTLEGSTDPVGAVREAHRLVAGSTAANRIVLMLTDGSFYNTRPVTAALAACRDEGALTAIIGLGSKTDVVPGFCGADVTASISDSGELVPIFRDIAERSMLAQARR